MTRVQITYSTLWRHLDPARRLLVYDAAEDGTAWLRSEGSAGRDSLYISSLGERTTWTPQDDDPVWIDPPGVPEPPDLTRIEFEHHTDMYAAWRDDASSAQAGWTAGDGGEVWCLFGSSVPRSWAVMWLEFGDSLRTAVRLVPHPDDAASYAKWPTALMAAEAGR